MNLSIDESLATSTPTTKNGTPATKNGSAGQSIARFAPAVARILLGLQFCASGVMGLLPIVPEPEPGSMPDGALAFMGAPSETGYMWPLISGIYLVAGVLLLANRFVPLAVLLLAPMLVNIVAFHLFLAPSGLPLVLVVLALELYLAWTRRSAFRGVLTAKPAT